jgi:cell division protein FtsN
MSAAPKQAQRGGFVMGVVVGLLVGLALALAVALYVTKVPIPFVNKVPQRSGDRDAEERERNKNWDPNSPLYGANPAKPNGGAAAAASGVVAPAEPVTAPPGEPAPTAAVPATPAPAPAPAASRSQTAAAPAASAPARAATSTRDPAAILGDKAASPEGGEAPVSTKPRDDPFMYFVQAGAYGRTEDAEQQRARLAMIGIETRITEREQAGRTVYRVRVGPFDKREQADATKERLEAAAVEATLVRVQK